MARTNSQAFGQDFDAAVLDAALANQTESSRNRVGRSEPGWSSRRTFWPATQARAKAGFCCRGRARKVPAVLFFCCRRRTNRTAVNATANHTDEEFPVESRITRQPSSRTYLPVQIHILRESLAGSRCGSVSGPAVANRACANRRVRTRLRTRLRSYDSRPCRAFWTFSDRAKRCSMQHSEVRKRPTHRY